jgi:hypothetical protein
VAVLEFERQHLVVGEVGFAGEEDGVALGGSLLPGLQLVGRRCEQIDLALDVAEPSA